jgi:hypothetical protein
MTTNSLNSGLEGLELAGGREGAFGKPNQVMAVFQYRGAKGQAGKQGVIRVDGHHLHPVRKICISLAGAQAVRRKDCDTSIFSPDYTFFLEATAGVCRRRVLWLKERARMEPIGKAFFVSEKRVHDYRKKTSMA